MANTISVYDTTSQGRTLLMENKAPELLQTRYFPTVEPFDLFDSKKVIIDMDNGDLESGAFVSRGYKDGNTTTSWATAVEPPRIGMEDTIDTKDRDRVLFEQLCRPMGGIAPTHGDALNALLRIKGMRLIQRGQRALARIIVMLLQNNKIEFTCDKSPTDHEQVTVSVDFTNGAENKQTFKPQKAWSDPAATPYKDVCAMVKLMVENGGNVEDLLLAPEAWEYLRANMEAVNVINNYSNQSDAHLLSEELHDARIVARCSFGGYMLNVITYSAAYKTPEGALKPFLPADFCCVLAPACGHTLCGAATLPNPISMIMDGEPACTTQLGRFIVSKYYDFADNQVKVRCESNPLPCPLHQWGWVSLGKPAA